MGQLVAVRGGSLHRLTETVSAPGIAVTLYLKGPTLEGNEWAEFYSVANAAHLLEASELKAALPIAYVLDDAGVVVSGQPSGNLNGFCPFHADVNTPSFDVFGENLERWGCYPCELNGDVFDLIQRLHSLPDFNTTREKAVELYTQMLSEGWEGPRKSEKKVLDTNFVKQVVDGAAVEEDLRIIAELLEAKDAPFSAEWLHETFGVGVYGSWIVIPYRTSEGETLTFKHRTPTTKPHALAGSSFDGVLYGDWLDTDPEKPVVLCEGESDTWAAAFAVGDTYTALGLPTGAGTREGPKAEQLGRLANRRVVVAFDGDKTGRSAVRKWYPKLIDAGCSVTVAPLPDGKDLSSIHDIAGTLALSRPIPAKPKGIQPSLTGYMRPARNEDDVPTPISNWTFDPTRELIGANGSAYEGLLQPSGREVVLSSFNLSSKGRMVEWAARHGGAWYGSDRDAQLLLGLLQADAPFLPVGRMATVAGLHDGHYVWPGGKIGPEHWQYVPPASDVHLEHTINIGPGNWDPTQLIVLRNFHQRGVMDPILAWLAAAPLRPLLHEFPILAVTGPAGSGKTTLLETVIPAFSGSSIFNTITNTTRHSVLAHIAATNAFPQWWDEYRPQARRDALDAMRQAIRDAWTMQASSRGGGNDKNVMEVTGEPMSSPLIISGEDSFDEVSHTDRMIQINLPIKGKSTEALNEVRSWGETGFPYAYLMWLHEGLRSGDLPDVRNYPAGPDSLGDRPRKSFGVLDLGWNLLTSFLQPFGVDLGDPNFSLVAAEAEEAKTHAPIEDALQWALEEADAVHFVCRKEIDGEIYVFVRLENFVHFVKQKSDFQLPGGVTAIRKYLQAKYGAEMGRIEHANSTKYMLGFKADLLQLN